MKASRVTWSEERGQRRDQQPTGKVSNGNGRAFDGFIE